MYDVILGAWSAVTDNLETAAVGTKDTCLLAELTEYGFRKVQEGDELVRRTDALDFAEKQKKQGYRDGERITRKVLTGIIEERIRELEEIKDEHTDSIPAANDRIRELENLRQELQDNTEEKEGDAAE